MSGLSKTEATEVVEGLKMLGVLHPEYGNTRSTHYRLNVNRARQIAETILEAVNGKQEINVSIGSGN